jgi:hypothetical protein
MRKNLRFTVREAGISIFISLTIFALAAPTILNIMAIQNLHSATREVIDDMESTKFLALDKNQTFRIDFNAGTYQIIRVSDNSIFKIRSLEDYHVQTTKTSITFFNRGSSSSGVVTLSNGLRTKSIKVNRLARVITS